MNSRDIQNLQEAYLGIYSEDFKELDPYKTELVQGRHAQLASDILKNRDEVERLSKKPFARHRPGIKAKIRDLVAQSKRKHKLAQNASDALIRSSVDRSAKIQKKIEDLKSQLPGNKIVKFNREEIEYIMNYLISEGYVSSYKEAEHLIEELTDEEFDFLYEDLFGIDELNEKHVRALEPVADRRTRFPEFAGKESEFDTKFLRTRVRKKSSKVDPGFSGGGFRRLKRKDIRRATVGGTTFRESYEYLISYLLDEGYANSLESAENIALHMSEDWAYEILNEAPYQVVGPPEHGPSDAEPVPIGKPYNFDPNDPESIRRARKRARRQAERKNLTIGGHRYTIRKVDEDYEEMDEGLKTDMLKSALRTTGKVAKYGAKKFNKSKLGQKAKNFVKRTTLGALGVPLGF